MMIPDPYRALNLPHSATLSQIKQSYRQLARKYHPDTWSQPCFSEADRKEATAKFTAISNAYALLSDASEKTDYDRTYRLGGYREEHTEPSSATATATGTSRNNDTTTTNNNTRNNTSFPPPPPPPPPQRSSITTDDGCWASAIDPKTRRVYYYNKATGERSWSLIPTHKQQQQQQQNPYHQQQEGCGIYSNCNYNRMHHNPQPTTAAAAEIDPPNSHSCESFLALLLCPPLGIFAVYHSIMVHQSGSWKEEKLHTNSSNNIYSKAQYYHASKAAQYACWANCLGICFWIYYWVVVVGTDGKNNGDFEWPDFFDFDWNDWGREGGGDP